MTQEEKELLLKDLCARFPYKIKIYCGTVRQYHIIQCLFIDEEDGHCDIMDDFGLTYTIEDVKPYLRSLSSMTDEEKKELSKKYVWNIWSGQVQIRYHRQGLWDDETECPTEEYITLFNWLNAHYFDYRGLIEKGLALEAPEDMYKLNNK